MDTSTSTVVRSVVGLALLVAAGSCIAAANWYTTWSSFANLDVEAARGAVSASTVQAQASFQQWALVALVALVICVGAMAYLMVFRARDDADGAPRGEELAARTR